MSLYMKYFSIQFKSIMQHKVSFYVMLTVQFLVSLTGYLALYFMFTRFNQVEGFTFNEIILCFAVMGMSFSIAEMFTRGFEVFARFLGDGRFDRILTRPRGVIFQILASQIEFHRLGRFTQSVIILAYAIPVCGVEWTADKISVLVLMVSCGAVVFFCLFLTHAGITFFTLHQMEFMEAFTKQGGISFLLISFHITGEIFFLPCEDIKKFYDGARNGGRKSIPYEAFDKAYIVPNKGGFPVHYLEAVNVYLKRKTAGKP